MKHSRLYLLLAGLALFGLGLLMGVWLTPTNKEQPTVSETRVTTWDTTHVSAPLVQSETALGTKSYTLLQEVLHGGGAGGAPRQCSQDNSGNELTLDTLVQIPAYGTGAGGEPRCCGDSVIIDLPLKQRHYADSTYEAWVSGPVDPRLDSIRVFVPTTVITKQEWKPPKRWHIGVTAGYGYGAKGFQPYIGIGLTYSIFSF